MNFVANWPLADLTEPYKALICLLAVSPDDLAEKGWIRKCTLEEQKRRDKGIKARLEERPLETYADTLPFFANQQPKLTDWMTVDPVTVSNQIPSSARIKYTVIKKFACSLT